MNELANNRCQIDVRKIQLRKAVSTDRSTPDAQWYTWGQYDELVASEVRYDAAAEHPLQTIWKDASSASNELNGDYQYFVQYLYKSGSNDRAKEFWTGINSIPLLVVTMLYFDKKTIQEKSSLCPEDIEKELDQYQVNQPDIISSIVYNTLDNCDAVIIWSTQSFRAVLNVITDLCNSNPQIVSTYSTFAYQSELLSGSNKLSMWSNDDRASMVIRLHGKCLANVQQVASDVQNYFLQNKAEASVVAGQDDILLCQTDVLLKFAISIYNQGAPLCPKAILERGVVCNTIIGFDFDLKGEVPVSCNQTSSPIVTQLIAKLKRSFNNEPYPIWFAPLCEALNELSSFEYDNTAKHVFHQLLGVQTVFTNYLCKRSSINGNFTARENAVILNYLEKWSHVSYSAQKAYWKLTQEADVNHIYLFPAKLNLLCAAYAHFVSKALTNSYNINDYCAFLLSPILGRAVNFGPVYLPSRNHTRVVYGEVPASHLFNPRHLFPLLVHEIAHYVGGDVRQRDERSKCCFVSLFLTHAMAVIDAMRIRTELTTQEINDVLTYIATIAIEYYSSDGEEQRIQGLMTNEQKLRNL